MLKFILLEPIHPGNIGAAARAMKTMGLSTMTLVAPRFFPSPMAHAMASGGSSILDEAVVVSTLQEALHDSTFIFGTAGRDAIMNFPLLEAREAAVLAQQKKAAGERVAFIFGRESTGLSNEELKLCHYHVRIPTADDFSSLNLAQAIQVIAYELHLARRLPQPTKPTPILADHDKTERFYARLETLLRQVDFLKPGHDKIILQKLRRLFQRAQLEPNEVTILQGIVSNIGRVVGLAACRPTEKLPKSAPSHHTPRKQNVSRL